MNYFFWILVAVILVLLLYTVANLNEKLRRMRKRYDLLLRGRGEINMEELLVAHGQDINTAQKRLAEVESRLKAMSSTMDLTQSDRQKTIDGLGNALQAQFAGRLDQIEDDARKRSDTIEKKMQSGFETMSRTFDEEMDRTRKTVNGALHGLEQSIHTQGDTLGGDLKKLQDDTFVRFQNVDSEINERAQNIFNELNARFAEDKREWSTSLEEMRDDTGDRFGTLNDSLTALSDAVHTSLEEVEKKTQDVLQRELLNMNNKLLLALQKISLYRYNAFENMVGNHSFTLCLLDSLNNGLMITSIYGRDGSHTFAKQIRDGKPQQALSEEEQLALNRAVGEDRIR